MGGMNWVKLYCDEWFEGSIRKEPIVVRAIWSDLLAFAGKVGESGVIRLPGCDVGYTDEQLSAIFNVEPPLWLTVKKRLSQHPGGDKENRITVNDRNVIEIINWPKYQSEYDRTKRYRKRNNATENATTKIRSKGTVENRIEVEVDLDLKKIKDNTPEVDGEYIKRCKAFYNEMMEGTHGPVVEDWEKLYGDVVNVPSALFAASTWLVENPRNRKKTFKKFYGNWLRNQYTRATQPRGR